ncbi:MAG: ABC transporter substrate-binding protein [Acidimicrobiales bacterium]
MLRFTRVRSALVMAGVASLLLATSVTAGAASTTGVYNAAAAKMVPASLKGKTLQVATDATYPPDEMMSGSTMIGFDVDLMKAIGTTLGLKINETNVTFDSIIAGIQAGKYQVGNSSFTDTKARQASVNFVDYFQAGEGVYAKSSSKAKFTGLMSFCGMSVAVETGTTEQSDAVATAKKCPSSKKLTVLPYPTQTSANLAVSSGRATVGFVDSQVAGYIVSQAKGAFKLVGKAIKVAPYGIATSKSGAGKGLALAIQKALKVMMANGTYHAILAKWGVTAGALPANKIILNGATS